MRTVADNLAGITASLRPDRAATKPAPEPEPAPAPPQAAEPTKLPQKGRGGKISDPDFQRLGILIRKSYLKKIQRHLLDAEGDISDFIDKALAHATMRMGE